MSADDLTETLTEILRPVAGITAYRATRSIYSTSFPIDDVQVELGDGSKLSLVRKDLSWSALLPEAARTKPRFLYDPMREIEVYRSLLDGTDAGTPKYYGAVADASRDRYWLFLEKVPGIELYQVGEASTWQAAARWLGGFHRNHESEASALAQAAPVYRRLVRHGPVYWRMWVDRALTFAPSDGRRRLLWLADRHDQVVEQLAALPTSVIHGEPYASNVLVGGAGNEMRVCPIDWEMAAVGPAALDLAALVTNWPVPQRSQFIDAYREGASATLATPDLDQAVTACQLQLALQWLGWADNWQAPEAAARDWLADAMAHADDLGL